MRLFSELRRRNVIRVATAYVVASWLIIQVAETILPAYGFGDAALRLVIALLAVAFIPTLVFSWVFEFTPQGLKREVEVEQEESITRFTGKRIDRVIMVLLALAVGFFLFDRLVLMPARETVIAEQARQEGAEQAREEVLMERMGDKSVAVLPFTTHGISDEDQVFADGMHDELMTRLFALGSLKVIYRNSVMQYRDTRKPLKEVADELSVATVLVGAVQRLGSQVRISAQLINARLDEVLWAGSFDRELTAENLFAIQREIAVSISESLEAGLSPRQEAQLNERPTNSLEAYNHFLHGRQLMVSRNTADLRQALEQFERALAIDPDYAQAWIQNAFSTVLLARKRVVTWGEANEVITEAAERSMALNDQLGEAYVLQAWLAETFEETDAAWRRAIELSPNNGEIRLWYAQFYAGADMLALERKLELYLRAAELDPLSSAIQNALAMAYMELGRAEESIEILERLIRHDPDFMNAYLRMGDHHMLRGQLVEAFKWYRKARQVDPESMVPIWSSSDVFRAVDDYKTFALYRDDMEERFPNQGTPFMNMVLALGHDDWQAALAEWEFPQNWLYMAILNLIGQEYETAYETWVEAQPRWADPAEWPQLIRTSPSRSNRGGCFAAGIFVGAGAENAQDLVTLSRNYMEKHYEGHETHSAEFWPLGYCYLVDGSWDLALDFWEQYVENGHWADFRWFLTERMPWWEPLREHPRYIALVQRVEDLKAEQREQLARYIETENVAVP